MKVSHINLFYHMLISLYHNHFIKQSQIIQIFYKKKKPHNRDSC